MSTNAAPSWPPEPSREELLARPFIRAGYRVRDVRNADGLRASSYWLENNLDLLGVARGKEARTSLALTPEGRIRLHKEFLCMQFLQAAPLAEVAEAMDNFVLRKDAIGADAAFAEFVELAVEPGLALLPPQIADALQKQIAHAVAERRAATVQGTPPPRAQGANRPDDPNTSGQAGSPRA